MMPLNVRIEATAEISRASSSCCGSPVDVVLGSDVPAWICRQCRGLCSRVMSAPETIKVVSNG